MAKRGKVKSKKKQPDVAHHEHAAHDGRAARPGKEKDAAETKAKRPQATRPRGKEGADELARIWDEDLCE